MALRINTPPSLALLLLVIYVSSGIVEGFSHGMEPTDSLHKEGVQMKSRKLLLLDPVLDYDYAGPNPRHDPRKGKPGNGRNP